VSVLLFGARNSDRDERKHKRVDWRSASDSIYLHVSSPHMFDVERWFHSALVASTPREAREDLVAGMKEARAAWLHQNPPSELLSHGSHDLRAVLGRSEARFDMRRMNDLQVARAVYDEIHAGRLIFVPERGEMRQCVQAIKEWRQKERPLGPARQQLPTAANPRRALHDNGLHVAQNLGRAKPFEYRPDVLTGEPGDLAARGVSDEEETECFAWYERDMDECTAYRMAMGGQRFMDECSQRAFENYQLCRGY